MTLFRHRQSDSPGKWLFVLPWDIRQVGGVNTAVLNLAGECAKSGQAVPEVLTGSWEHPKLTESVAQGLPLAQFRMRSPASSAFDFRPAAAFMVTLPWTLAVLSRYLQRHNVAVVNVHYPGLTALLFVFLRRLRLFHGTLLLSIHGSDVFQAARSTAVVRRIWQLMLTQCEAVIACSAALGRECADAFPASKAKLHIIHNGVNVSGIEHAAAHGQVPDQLRDVPFLLSVGNFVENKGHDVLLRAFVRLAPANPGLHLVCIGQAGPSLPGLQAVAREQNLADRVHFLLDITPDTVGAYYAAARLFVQPSRREGLGIALLEAGVLRKPVVASSVGGIPEIVAHGKTGLLVPPEDDRALADALAMLLADPALAATLGEALHRLVRGKFTWTHAWQQYLDVAQLEPQPPSPA